MAAIEARDESPTLGAEALKELLGVIEAPVVILDARGVILHFNPACERLTGYSAAEACGRRVFDFLIPEDEAAPVRQVHEETCAGPETHFVNHWKTKDGERRLLRWSNKAIRNEAGAVAAVLATAVDITELSSAEHQLSESKAFLQSVIDSSPVAIVTANERNEILTFSRAAERMFGYRPAEAVGGDVARLFSPSDPARAQGFDEAAAASAIRANGTQRASLRRRNGEDFPALINVSAFMDGERIFVGFIEDISERKAMERRLAETQDQLHHAGRLGAMGEIATSIAHELNQPLTAAASLAGAVALTIKKQCAEGSDEAVSMLEDAIGEIRRASEIIRHMREFVRQRKTDRSLQEINKVVEEAGAVALIGAEAEGIDVVWDLAPDAGAAMLDRIQIQQVLTNLIRNAIDAMAESPTRQLTISTARREGWVAVSVADTGPGLSDAIKTRLFEPFVSGKDTGLGVGLSISKSIIDAHQGDIFANDRTSGGCVFTFKLPAGDNGEAKRSA